MVPFGDEGFHPNHPLYHTNAKRLSGINNPHHMNLKVPEKSSAKE
jgi:hypothetical protein